jgi:hypothetical protein
VARLGFDALFDDALRIAMDYLEGTGQWCGGWKRE